MAFKKPSGFYVYEWIRLDTNEPFYVGKGYKDRWKFLHRKYNKDFLEIVNNIPVAVNILNDNLSEEESFGIECYYINLYRYTYGYNLCNKTEGGEGSGSVKITSKKVICLTTNKIFDSIGSAARKYNIQSIKDIVMACDGHRRFAGKLENGERLVWMYYDEYKQNKEDLKKRLDKDYTDNKYVYKSKLKGVVCVTTGEVFESIKIAQLKYKKYGAYHVSACCNGKRKTSGKMPNGTKLEWKFL